MCQPLPWPKVVSSKHKREQKTPCTEVVSVFLYSECDISDHFTLTFNFDAENSALKCRKDFNVTNP